MTRQAFIRVLLSLLLLISQQMASSHVMSHLAGSGGNTAPMQAQQTQTDGGELSDAFAQDPTCHQCLAFAQLSGPLGSKAHVFDLPNPGSFRIAARAVHDSGARTILAFQSRGPPQA